MDITELADALAALPYRFDFLLFDDCFMANIETLYDLRASVDHVIASPCEIMADGFPYDRIIPQMFTDEGRSHDLGAVCYEFWNLYQNDYASTIYRMQSGCITLAVMSEIDRLADVMRRINRTPAAEYNPNTLQTYEGLSPHLFYDMGQYVSVRCSDAALLDEFAECFDAAFPPESRLHTDGFYSAYNNRMNPITHYSGITISEPSTKFTEENRTTNWYRATHE